MRGYDQLEIKSVALYKKIINFTHQYDKFCSILVSCAAPGANMHGKG